MAPLHPYGRFEFDEIGAAVCLAFAAAHKRVDNLRFSTL